MSDTETSTKKREATDENEDDDSQWIGPMPSEAAKPKKRKGNQPRKCHHNNIYLLIILF